MGFVVVLRSSGTGVWRSTWPDVAVFLAASAAAAAVAAAAAEFVTLATAAAGVVETRGGKRGLHRQQLCFATLAMPAATAAIRLCTLRPSSVPGPAGYARREGHGLSGAVRRGMFCILELAMPNPTMPKFKCSVIWRIAFHKEEYCDTF